MAAECNDSGADGAFVDPARYYPLFSSIPFDGFPSLANNDYSLSIAPPFEVRNAAFAFDADFCYPLTGVRVENVDSPATLSAGANETHPSTTGAEFEALHTPLVFPMSDYSRYFLHSPGFEIPDVEIAAAAGEEDAVSGGRVEQGRCEGCGAEMESRESGVWVWWVRGYVVEG